MNSFMLIAIGNLARNPEIVSKGDMAFTRFCLVGNDYAERDEEGAAREVVTSVWFVAFGSIGEALARNSREGDQLIVEAKVRANNGTDPKAVRFIVEGFRFGAPGPQRRAELQLRSGPMTTDEE